MFTEISHNKIIPEKGKERVMHTKPEEIMGEIIMCMGKGLMEEVPIMGARPCMAKEQITTERE